MPKTSKLTALQKTRRLLKTVQVKITDSSSDSETPSDISDEFSHVPVKNTPDLGKISLSDNEKDSEMDQLIAQIQNLTETLQTMQSQQQQQQQTINTLLMSQAQSGQPVPHHSSNATGIEYLFKIPDPIKAIPRFDGNRKQLTAWLATAENTLAVFKDHVSDCQYSIFVTAILNKIEGKAKDIICLAGNPQSFNEIKEILINALGDRQELTYYKSQLWQTKMTENTPVHKHYNRCKETIQNIKTLAKQKPLYREHWEAINAFIEEDALAAFLAGLKEPYFGYAQASKPEDMEGAYAFVCKFRSKETTASNMDTHSKKKDFKPYDKTYNTTRQRPQFDKNKNDKTEPTGDTPQPMDTGSTNSRLTLNRRTINNNEIEPDPVSSESDSETEDINVNFWHTDNRKHQT